MSYGGTNQGVTDDIADNESLCWDEDGDGDCAANAEARATLSFGIRGVGDVGTSTDTGDVNLTAAFPANPFERVVFYVQLEDDEDIDGTTTDVWAYLGEGRGRASSDNGDTDDATYDRDFSWRLNVQGAQVAAAAELTTPGTVNIQAVGYTAGGSGGHRHSRANAHSFR